MPTYLTDAPNNTPRGRIYGCWNSGLEKDEARAHIIKRFGVGQDAELDRIWADLEAEFGGGCIPPSPGKTEAQLLREMEEEPEGMFKDQKRAYLDWKGVTGKGARLRNILAEQKAVNA